LRFFIYVEISVKCVKFSVPSFERVFTKKRIESSKKSIKTITKMKNHRVDNKKPVSVPKLCIGISLVIIGILFVIIWPTFYEFILYKVSFIVYLIFIQN
jgi:hypothetical protein